MRWNNGILWKKYRSLLCLTHSVIRTGTDNIIIICAVLLKYSNRQESCVKQDFIFNNKIKCALMVHFHVFAVTPDKTLYMFAFWLAY